MKTLVTGGAGFIGSTLAERLLKEGHHVDVLDNLHTDHSAKLLNMQPYRENKRFFFVEGDIRDREILMRYMRKKKFDYVFHQAALADVRYSLDHPLEYNDVNITGTINLLQGSVDTGVMKFINASSSSVYGDSPVPFKEELPCSPVSPYGMSKFLAEKWCELYSKVYGLDSVSLRYFNVFGPKLRSTLAISIFTKCAFTGKDLEVFGKEQLRDYTFVDDVVEANLLAMGKGSGILNIGNNDPIKIVDLANKILSIVWQIKETKSKVKVTDYRKGDAMATQADFTKAKKELGWRPRVPFDDGLEKTVKSITPS